MNSTDSSIPLPDYTDLSLEEIIARFDHRQLRLIAKDLAMRANKAQEAVNEYRRQERASPELVDEARSIWARRAADFVRHALSTKRSLESAAFSKASASEEQRRMDALARKAAQSAGSMPTEALEVIRRAIGFIKATQAGLDTSHNRESLETAVNEYELAILKIKSATRK